MVPTNGLHFTIGWLFSGKPLRRSLLLELVTFYRKDCQIPLEGDAWLSRSYRPGEGRVVVSVSSMPMLIPPFSFAFNYSLGTPESQALAIFLARNEIFCGDEAAA